MGKKVLWILISVVAVLLAFIFLVERRLPSSDERSQRAKMVVPFAEDEVRAMHIEHQGESLRFELVPLGTGEWRLVEPLRARATPSDAEGLLFELTSLEKERTLQDMARSEAGLDPPRARVTLRTDTGEEAEETVLEIGAEVPNTDAVLVGIAGSSPVYQVPGGFWEHLERPAEAWRDRQLVRSARQDIEKISVRYGDKRYSMSQTEDTFWMEEPFNDLIDQELADSLVTQILGLRAEKFLDGPQQPELAEVGLEPAIASLRVLVKGRAEPFVVQFGRLSATDDNQRYGRADRQLLETTGQVVTALARAPEEWRSKRLTLLQDFEIESLKIQQGDGQTLDLSRGSEGWDLAGKTLPATTVDSYLEAVLSLSSEDFAEASVLGTPDDVARRAPDLELTLVSQDSFATILRFYRQASDIFVRADGRETLLKVPTEGFAAITGAIRRIHQETAQG